MFAQATSASEKALKPEPGKSYLKYVCSRSLEIEAKRSAISRNLKYHNKANSDGNL